MSDEAQFSPEDIRQDEGSPALRAKVQNNFLYIRLWSSTIQTQWKKMLDEIRATIIKPAIRGGFNVDDVRYYGTIAAAVAAIPSTQSKTLFITNEQVVTSNLTIPSNISIHVLKGGSFSIATGVTLTINGPFSAGLFRVFTWTGTGDVAFGAGVVDSTPGVWFGASADDTDGTQTDNSIPIQKALDATRQGGRVTLEDGDYGLLDTLYFRERNHLVGGLRTHLRFWGSTSGDPLTALWYDAENADFNGGAENLLVFNMGEDQTGIGLYLEGSIPSENGHNVQRTSNRNLYFSEFEKAIHFENVAYINAFYNIRAIRCKVGIYAKNAANAVNFFGYYYDGGNISNTYGIQYKSDNNPTYYNFAINFFGGAIENCEHAIYTDQNVFFTSQFYGTYFEGGDIELQSGHITMVGCNTSQSASDYHVHLSGSAILDMYTHTYSGTLTGSDASAALVRVESGATYTEHGRTRHNSLNGMTGRTNPKINRDSGTYVRYWGIDASTGADEGVIREFGNMFRLREAAGDSVLTAYSNADTAKVEIRPNGVAISPAGASAGVLSGSTSGGVTHLQIPRFIPTEMFRLPNYATASRPTSNLFTYAQINDQGLEFPLLYSGSGTIWRTASRRWRPRKTGVSLNSAATDVSTIEGLPAKYRIIKITAYDASTSLAASAATYDLRTASGGGGTAIVAAQGVTALSAASKFADGTLAAFTADYCTAQTLYIRCVTAHGSAATVSFLLEIEQMD